MSKVDKTLAKMKANSLDWRIEDLQAVARRFEIDWRHDGSSHCVFVTASGKTLPVPAKKPIKPIYIKKFLLLLEEP
ncbi:MAG: type II toxin-antitoxin system HicA family toxin [Desulfuromonadaceae bacterium]|nr:type II toxin-antitoxin system HicA family toxin [Desulfuromonadaceae bacterium]